MKLKTCVTQRIFYMRCNSQGAHACRHRSLYWEGSGAPLLPAPGRSSLST